MEKYILSQGVKVYYTVQNPGHDAVVLMHGWGCQGATLTSIANVAVDTHTVINIDFPGFGHSDEPNGVWGVAEYTQVLVDVINSEGVKSPTLLGHSFGGRVGLLYASTHKDVRRLILVDAAGIRPRRSINYYLKVYTYKLYKRILYMVIGANRAESRLESIRVRRGSADYGQSSPRMRAVLSKVVNEDLKYVMPDITAPTLLIWGANDTATPISDARYMERHIPGAGLVTFEGCGHYSFLDNPVQFAAVLRSFLNS